MTGSLEHVTVELREFEVIEFDELRYFESDEEHAEEDVQTSAVS